MTALEVKAIKPERMNVNVFRRAMEKTLREEAKLQQKRLRRTVTTWKDKPEFESLTDFNGKDAIVITGPTGSGAQKWVWTDKGTRPHIIRARNAPALRFQTGSIPKTRPGQFNSGRSKRFGAWRRPKAVRHPGTKARGWSEKLAKERSKPFARRMQENISRAARQAY